MRCRCGIGRSAGAAGAAAGPRSSLLKMIRRFVVLGAVVTFLMGNSNDFIRPVVGAEIGHSISNGSGNHRYDDSVTTIQLLKSSNLNVLNDQHHHHRRQQEEEEEEGEGDNNTAEDNSNAKEEDNPSPTTSNDDKRLILFIGPRKSGSSAIEKFFYTHASNQGNNQDKLNGWIWPTYDNVQHSNAIPDNVPPHKVFSLYMEKPNNNHIKQILDTGIVAAWQRSKSGIVIGSELFDKILDMNNDGNDQGNGNNRQLNKNKKNNNKNNNHNHNNNNNNDHNNNNHNNNNNNNHHNKHDANAAEVLKHFQDLLGISSDRVTVILNYRTPRVDQWVSLFQHHTHESNANYHHFLCGGGGPSKRMREEFVATAMNPLGIASKVIDQLDYNVVVVDMAGAAMHNIDVAHAMYCHVLLEREEGCGDDIDLSNLNANFPEDHKEDHDAFTGIHQHKQNELEQLFRERDCHYRSLLENDPKFSILYQDTLWKGCKNKDQLKESYAQLASEDDQTLLKAIQAQKDCNGLGMNSSDVGDLLVGNYHQMTTSQYDKEMMTTREEQPGSSLFGGRLGGGTSDAFTDQQLEILMAIFLAFAVGAGLFSLWVGAKKLRSIQTKKRQQYIDENFPDEGLGSSSGDLEFSSSSSTKRYNQNIV